MQRGNAGNAPHAIKQRPASLMQSSRMSNHHATCKSCHEGMFNVEIDSDTFRQCLSIFHVNFHGFHGNFHGFPRNFHGFPGNFHGFPGNFYRNSSVSYPPFILFARGRGWRCWIRQGAGATPFLAIENGPLTVSFPMKTW